MTYSLTEEQRAIQDLVRRVARLRVGWRRCRRGSRFASRVATAVPTQAAAVLRVLESAENEAKREGVATFARLVEEYGGCLAEVMSALAESLTVTSLSACGG